MSIFNSSEELSNRPDWNILQNGWACLYWEEGLLNKDLSWFKNAKYDIVDFDCSKWTNVQIIHDTLKKQLQFPHYYGNNLNALNDSLSDLSINENGFAMVFKHFQIVEKNFAHDFLNVLANNARQQLLFGKVLLFLIQVDDPKFQIAPIGASPVLWNNSEWLTRNREL